MGAEKFVDIKCRMTGLRPDCVVIIATIPTLKMHGGVPKDICGKEENLPALEKGLANLIRHVENIRNVFGLPAVVAMGNRPNDTDAEFKMAYDACAKLGVKVIWSRVWSEGGKGGAELAEEVVRLCEQPSEFKFCYSDDMSIKEKIEAIATRVYRADGVDFIGNAQKQLTQLEDLGFGKLPICMAKTQYSLSDDAKKLGAPENFRISVRNLKVSAGAGFIVALTGDVMTMPGLPKVPSAEKIDVDGSGRISGLF